MGKETGITWTDATWNIARGCTKVDEDCKFCYMYRDSFDSTRYNPLDVVRTKTVFDFPLKYKETKSQCWNGNPLIFTSSLTDFFHEAIDGYRNEAWDIIRRCPHLIFQILTKRPERIMDHVPADWGDGWDNVWLGTSVGSPKGVHRINWLEKVKAKTKFISFEPLHQELTACFVANVDWIILGGESGNENGKYKYRPCEISWFERIINSYQTLSDTGAINKMPAVFVKQMGTHLAKQMGLSDRHGGNIDEFPKHLQIRQFPVMEAVHS